MNDLQPVTPDFQSLEKFIDKMMNTIKTNEDSINFAKFRNSEISITEVQPVCFDNNHELK